MATELSDQLMEFQPKPLMRRLMPGLLLLGITVFLFPLKDFSPYAATFWIGLLGILSVVGCVLLKYRKDLRLDAEVAFLMGVTIQYMLAPWLARVLSNDFTADGWSMTGERWIVKDSYGGAMIIVLVFIATYLITSALIAERRIDRMIDGRLAMTFTYRSYLMFGLFAVQLWLVRMALLATGTYYHIHRTKFQFEDARASGWMQVDMGIGMAVLAYFWGAGLTKAMPMSFVVIYTIFDFLWSFSSGSRERTVMVGVIVLLTFIVYRNRVPIKTMALLFVPVLLLIGFMDHYRYAIQNYAERNTIQISAIVRAFEVAQERTERAGAQSTFMRGVARLNDLDSIAAIYSFTPSVQPYIRGETYQNILPALVPRQLWKDKPMVIQPINTWFFRHEGGSSPITIMGEGYLNFGWLGVPLAGIMCAIMVRGTERFIARFMYNLAMLPVYIAFLGIIARLHTSSAAVWITTLIKMALMVIIVHVVTRPAAWQRRQPGETQQEAQPGTAAELTPMHYN